MNILILGSGGRECALAWKISQSHLCTNLYIAPGNGGTDEYGENINISPSDFLAVATFCLEKQIQLVIVGPEDPLVNGIVDFFKSEQNLKQIAIIGPDKFAAQLEGSKSFAKGFMKKYLIPTAAYKSFDPSQLLQAKEFLNSLNPPYVIKADGLAAGKGVLICNDMKEAEDALNQILTQRAFGDAGNFVVIEEFLDGIELSIFALTDGNHFVMLPDAKDYKRIGDDNTGLNTGGMGTASPVPFADEEFMKKVISRIVVPTINGIKEEKMHYCGFVFFGLMNVNGNPYVIEYNARLGDPETQSILPRLANDLVELLMAANSGELHKMKTTHLPLSVVNVVLASGGYPESYEKEKPILTATTCENQIVFHAGTKTHENQLVTSGGRVMSACGTGTSLQQAIDNAYELAEKIAFENKYYRKDIGKDLLKYIK